MLLKLRILLLSLGCLILANGCGGGSSGKGRGDAATSSTGGTTTVADDASAGADVTARGGTGATGGATGGAVGGATGGAGSGGITAGGATSVSIPLTPTWTASTLPLDHYCEVMLDTICRLFARCTNNTASNAYYELCLAQNRPRLQFSCTQSVNQIGTSSIVYNAANAASCVRQYDQAGCADVDVISETSPCVDIVTGSVPLNGECTDDGECANHRMCASSGTCPGHCTDRHVEGQPCSKDAHCGTGLGCGNGVCVKRTPIGQSCVSGSSVCEGLSSCLLSAQGDHVCRSMGDLYKQEEGATCDTSTETLCRDGLACMLPIDASGTATSKIGTCKAPLADGQACSILYPSPCIDYSYCAIDPGASLGTCQPWPGDGQPCGYFGTIQAVCGAGLVCINKTCQPMLSTGASCTTSDECQSNFCQTGTCSTNHSCDTAVPG